MFCNGACCFCSVPCSKNNSVVVKNETTNKVVVSKNATTTEENIGTYEIKKSLFGKDKVRKVKNENRKLGIEYIT